MRSPPPGGSRSCRIGKGQMVLGRVLHRRCSAQASQAARASETGQGSWRECSYAASVLALGTEECCRENDHFGCCNYRNISRWAVGVLLPVFCQMGSSENSSRGGQKVGPATNTVSEEAFPLSSRYFAVDGRTQGSGRDGAVPMLSLVMCFGRINPMLTERVRVSQVGGVRTATVGVNPRRIHAAHPSTSLGSSVLFGLERRVHRSFFSCCAEGFIYVAYVSLLCQRGFRVFIF